MDCVYGPYWRRNTLTPAQRDILTPMGTSKQASVMLTRFGTLILVALPLLAVDPAPLPKVVREAKKLFIVNENVEDSIHDRVYDIFRHWSRWTLVDDQKDADIIVVLSAQNTIRAYMTIPGESTTTATATTYGNTTVVGAHTQENPPTVVPIGSYPRYLSMVDPKSGARVLTVSCELRLAKGRTGLHLMDRLKNRFPTNERK